MGIPPTAENLLALIRSLPVTDRHWLLAQLEQNAELSSADLAQLAMEAGAFADLEDEPDLYKVADIIFKMDDDELDSAARILGKLQELQGSIS